jgi:hypothetical protein
MMAPNAVTRGVLVIGMHRSGTSVATQAIARLGLSTCIADDLLGPSPGNARGHWESRSLMSFNESLLTRLGGGGWWCPPADGRGLRALDNRLDEARHRFLAVHPADGWVWKDPRNSVLLPFWRRALDQRPAVLLMLRHPLDIARSLHQRDRLSLEWSIALWERYLRAALTGCDGLQVLVSSYDRLVADPRAWGSDVADLLDGAGLTNGRPIDSETVADCVDPELRHSAHEYSIGVEDRLGDERGELLGTALRLQGLHREFVAPDLPEESEATRAFMQGLRDRHRASVAARSGHDGPTVPSTSVVVTGVNGSWRALAARLGSATNGRVEIIAVACGSTNGARVRPVDLTDVEVVATEAAEGSGAARDAGAAAANGDVIVFADGDALPLGGWLEPLRQALAEPGVGAVGPAVVSPHSDAEPVVGLTFVDAGLAVSWVPEMGPEPTEVPLLSGCLLAVRRDAYYRVGGFHQTQVALGYEDQELCLRMWRVGLACVAVPASRVAHPWHDDPARAVAAARAPGMPPVAAPMFAGPLRLATLHLGPERLRRHVAAVVAGRRGTGVAFGELLGGDAGPARERIRAMSQRDDAWFFRRFDIRAFDAKERTDGDKHTDT